MLSTLDEAFASSEEIRLIAEHNTYVGAGALEGSWGANLTRGGEGSSGCMPNEETRMRISKAMKGKPSPQRGRQLTLEHRAKLSEAHRGKKMSDEARSRMSESAKRRAPHSEETRKKMSASIREALKRKWEL